MNEKLHIVYATDRRYLFPTQVAASSAVAWASRREDLVIDILDCGISDSEWLKFSEGMRSRLGNAFGLVRHRIDMSRYDTYPSWHNSKGLYARLELPQILNDVDWCVYGDGDTLFTDDPLKLEKFFDNRYALWGHKDVFDEKQIKWHTAHGLPWNGQERICSGFLVMNLKWFRDKNGVEELFKFIKQFPDIVYPDQDALNYVCRDYIGLLPDGWGCFSLLCDSVENIGCIHYTIERPWQLKITGRYFPLVSSTWLWFDTMAKCYGVRNWPSTTISFWRYLAALLKTRIFLMVFKIARKMPIVGSRYRNTCCRHWGRDKLNRYRIKVL